MEEDLSTLEVNEKLEKNQKKEGINDEAILTTNHKREQENGTDEPRREAAKDIWGMEVSRSSTPPPWRSRKESREIWKSPREELAKAQTVEGDEWAGSPRETMRKKGPCKFYAQGRCNRGEYCRWRHGESMQTVTATSIRVMTATLKAFQVPYHQRVLVDTGANEVIRPYHHQWWMDIINGRSKGSKVVMKLAGNVTENGLMTATGEVMMRSSMKRGSYDIGWILPMSRMQEELGMEARWRGDGSAVLIYPDGTEIKLIKDQSLHFIEWDQFRPIKDKLVETHRKGRPGSNKMSPTVNMVVHCSQCCIATQTDEDPPWESWTTHHVMEDEDMTKEVITISDDEEFSKEEECVVVPHDGSTYSKESERCREALGMGGSHEREKTEYTNVMCADLSGPHPEAVGTKFKYMMVAVFNPGQKGKNLPFVRLSLIHI